MLTLHEIPKEKYITDQEKHGILYLHSIGYDSFKRSSNGIGWTVIYTSRNLRYDNLDVLPYAFHNEEPIENFDYSWIVS